MAKLRQYITMELLIVPLGYPPPSRNALCPDPLPQLKDPHCFIYYVALEHKSDQVKPFDDLLKKIGRKILSRISGWFFPLHQSTIRYLCKKPVVAWKVEHSRNSPNCDLVVYVVMTFILSTFSTIHHGIFWLSNHNAIWTHSRPAAG